MYYVYCLTSKKNKKFHYYGYTSDLQARFRSHTLGKVRTTNRFLPVELLGYVEFEDNKDALKYEKDLKSKASYRNCYFR